MLVADALVALRAALEHALFAEVESRDGPLDEKAARLVEIPAFRKAEDFLAWAKVRARHGPASLRPGTELVKTLDALQPFHRKDAEDHPLARLVLHTNHAKHRTPAVTAVRIAAMYQEDERPIGSLGGAAGKAGPGHAEADSPKPVPGQEHRAITVAVVGSVTLARSMAASQDQGLEAPTGSQ